MPYEITPFTVHIPDAQIERVKQLAADCKEELAAHQSNTLTGVSDKLAVFLLSPLMSAATIGSL